MSIRNLLSANNKSDQDIKVNSLNCNILTAVAATISELNVSVENISATTIDCTLITAGTGDIETVNTDNLNCHWTTTTVAYPSAAVVDQNSGLIIITGTPVIAAGAHIEVGVTLPGVDSTNTTILLTQWADNNADASKLSLMVDSLSSDVFTVRIANIHPTDNWPGGIVLFFYFVPSFLIS